MTTRDPDDQIQVNERGTDASEEEVETGPPPTPFDHPLFLPVILIALTLWFGYDGFINQDPKMLEHVGFNRGGFVVLALLSAWFGYKAFQEMQEIKEQESSEDERQP